MRPSYVGDYHIGLGNDGLSPLGCIACLNKCLDKQLVEETSLQSVMLRCVVTRLLLDDECVDLAPPLLEPRLAREPFDVLRVSEEHLKRLPFVFSEGNDCVRHSRTLSGSRGLTGISSGRS